MPPKKKDKTKRKSSVRIDAHKHDAALEAIELQHQIEAERLEREALEELLLLEEEMEEEGEEEQSIYSEVDLPIDVGRIDLSFPETKELYADSPECFPPTYYTLSPKERLLLLYAENFRKQYVFNYPQHRPLVLAPRNECDVQKFVCSTVRPTAFLLIPLIGSIEGIASFVADFIVYEPLEHVAKPPTRLISPASLLRRRLGNSFEMATLLASMLIGAGFPAMVVSGVAREATVLNDQREVPYPHPIKEVTYHAEEEEKPPKVISEKYKLREMPDLESHLEENMREMLREKEDADRQRIEAAEAIEREELEMRTVDRYHYRRSHAWVVILENAPWSIQPRKTFVNEDGEVEEEPPSATFIEPSTGFACDPVCKQYILIDSVWNNHNYYVNRQIVKRVGEIRWDLRKTEDWEHLLPGEPPELRIHDKVSDENLNEPDGLELEEKHLDTIRSWVMKLHVGLKEYEQRFPKLSKAVHYKRALHERFSPYTQRDGKVMQLEFYEDDDYQEPLVRWEYFENRADLLQSMKYTHETEQIEESFGKGRNDSLKFMVYNKDPSKPKYMHFYSAPRLDSMRYMEVEAMRILRLYDLRSDRCYYQEFELKPGGSPLKKITEKFHRNTSGNVPANKDIAMRTFLIVPKQILLKFQYARGALTASTREFIKPPKPHYGHEIEFDPQLTKGYKASVSDEDPTPLELYQLLLAQLKAEESKTKEFEHIVEEMNAIFDLRRAEMRHPVLKFRIFDPLRNGAARAFKLQQHAAEEAHKREVAMKPADFLAPYLVPYKDRDLTEDEAWAAYNACLSDMKLRFVGLLNDLQRQYEDLTTEATALKRFLNKFENQFNNYDYENLVEQAKSIELNKRMVQQRLTLTHETAQKKYETVKESLLHDPRLKLRSSTVSAHFADDFKE